MTVRPHLLYSALVRAKTRASLACTGFREPGGSWEPGPWRGIPGAAGGTRLGADRAEQECDRVRIMIAGPPKAGNVWLKCLLGHIYGLRPLTRDETPQRPQFHL